MKPKTELFLRKLPWRVGIALAVAAAAAFLIVYPVADIAGNGLEGVSGLTEIVMLVWLVLLLIGAIAALAGVFMLLMALIDKGNEWHISNAARIEALEEKVSKGEAK